MKTKQKNIQLLEENMNESYFYNPRVEILNWLKISKFSTRNLTT